MFRLSRWLALFKVTNNTILLFIASKKKNEKFKKLQISKQNSPMLGEITHVIFDLDGTLIDSENLATQVSFWTNRHSIHLFLQQGE